MAALKEERFDQPMKFDQYLGQLDMELHPLWNKAWKGQDQKAFEQILYDMGADLAFGYGFNVCLHRARTSNKVEYGMRVSFKERTDKKWMDTMMDVTDIIRNTHSSIRTTGMLEVMNDQGALYETIVQETMKMSDIACFDIKVNMGDEPEKGSKGDQ